MLLLFLFNYLPMYGAIIAFKNFNPILGITNSPWIGLNHFHKLLESPFFWRVFRNTLLINLYKLCTELPIAILLAILINELRNIRYKRYIQTVTYLPHFLSWVIVGSYVVTVLSPNTGVINFFSQLFGIQQSNFYLVDPKYFRSIIVLSHLWKYTGWSSIIFLASLTGIDPQLYEAAVIDGASKIKQIIYVTLPGIMSTVFVIFIIKIGQMFLGYEFEQVFVLYTPNVYEVGDVISTYVYREGILKASYSYTTAVGLFQSVIGFILLVSANKIARRFDRSLW